MERNHLYKNLESKSNEELIQILQKQDLYTDEAVQEVNSILKERGLQVSIEPTKEIKSNVSNTRPLHKPKFLEITPIKVLIAVYFLFLFISSFFDSKSFFHDNSNSGLWAFLSFIIFSSFLVWIDLLIIKICRNYFRKKSIYYIWIIEISLFLLVILGGLLLFKNSGFGPAQ